MSSQNDESNETELCGFRTKKGEKCKLRALGDLGRCVHHADWETVGSDSGDDDGAEPESRDQPVWERQREQLLGAPRE